MEYRLSRKGVYVLLAILLILLVGLILYFFRTSIFTGRAINLEKHVEGQPLKGTFTVTPVPGIGTIPYYSYVKLSFHSDSGDLSKTFPLSSLLSQDYKDVNLQDNLTFYPVTEIVIGFTPKQEGLDSLPDQTFKIRKSFDTPGVLNIDPNYLPYIKDVLVRGASLPHSQAYLVNTTLTHYRVGSRYQESIRGFPDYAEDLVIPLDTFDLVTPEFGTLTAQIAYFDTSLYSEFLDIQPTGSTTGGGSGSTVDTSSSSNTSVPTQPIVPFDPQTDPTGTGQLSGGDFSACHDYTCEVFGECSIPSFGELSHGNYLGYNTQKALCHYTDCGKTFTFAKPCTPFEEAHVSILGIKPKSIDSKSILVKYGTKGEFSSDTRIVSVVDDDKKAPVANLIYDSASQNPYLDVAFVQSSPELISHCYDATLNFDEVGTDCGGNECKACGTEENSYPTIFIWAATCVSLMICVVFYRKYKLEYI